MTSVWYVLASHFSTLNKNMKEKHKMEKLSGITACVKQVAWQPNELNFLDLSV